MTNNFQSGEIALRGRGLYQIAIQLSVGRIDPVNTTKHSLYRLDRLIEHYVRKMDWTRKDVARDIGLIADAIHRRL